MKPLLLFDLDGTLLDTLQDLTDSVNHTLLKYNCPTHTREQVCSFVGHGVKNLIQRALPGKPDDPAVEDVLTDYLEYYALHNLDSTAPYAGIAQMLTRLADYPVAIASNKADQDVKPLCRRFFPGVYARGETADCPRKPAPDMLWQIMDQLGCQKCIYIGDSEVDIQTAKNAGIPCISVTWGFRTRQQLLDAGAAYLCERPEALPALVYQLEETVLKEK